MITIKEGATHIYMSVFLVLQLICGFRRLPLLFLGGVSCIINCHTLFIEMYCNVCETPLFHGFLR